MAKKRFGSKNKGNVFERKICRALSQWWFPEKDFSGAAASQLPFRRTQGSGGFDSRSDPGDLKLVVPSPVPFRFFVECKNRNSWSFDAILKKKATGVFAGWWKKCREQAADAELTPLLIFSKNYAEDWVAIPAYLYRHLHKKQVFSPRVVVYLPKIRTYLVPLEDLVAVSPKSAAHYVAE